MRRLLTSRAVLFLAERALSAGGGLLLTALIVRSAGAEASAGYLAAFALASLIPPLFANAASPLAIRLWRDEGAGAWAGFVAILFAASAAAALALALWGGPLGPYFALHVALSPAALAAAPFLAADRFRALLAVLIPAGLVGLSARILALQTGDLSLVALLYAVEPLAGGLILARKARAFRRPRLTPATKRALIHAAPPLMAAVGAATLFWRSPVLLADAFLGAEAVVSLAIAMQIVTGLTLPAQALVGGLLGPIARGVPEAPAAAGLVALGVAGGAALFALSLGDWAMVLIYGPPGEGAAAHLIWLAPLAGFAALWRLTQISGGLVVDPWALAATRAAAPAGQAVVALMLFAAPSAPMIAMGAPLSMAASALIAPLFAPSLRRLLFAALGGAARALVGGPELAAIWRLYIGGSNAAPVSARSSA